MKVWMLAGSLILAVACGTAGPGVQQALPLSGVPIDTDLVLTSIPAVCEGRPLRQVVVHGPHLLFDSGTLDSAFMTQHPDAFIISTLRVGGHDRKPSLLLTYCE